MLAQTMVTGLYKSMVRPGDPLYSFRFQVEVDGLLFAGFTEVSGLSVEIETESYHEGGVNDALHQLPKSVKYQNIVLKQGILYSDQMWSWIQDVKNGIIKKRNGRILLLGNLGLPVWFWNFNDAYPVKWSASDLNATGNDVFVETLELSHSGIEKSSAGMAAASNLIQ
jgi:phage tail-like protein